MSAPIVYFHGLPGGPEEWTACAPSGLSAFVPDRNTPIDPGTQMAQVLRNGLGRNPGGFASEVCAHVGDRRAMLEVKGVPVTIWQGKADNWTPPNMTEALAKALPGPVTVNRLPGLSHYSTLRHALAHLA